MHRIGARTARGGLVGGVLALGLALCVGGCVGYASYPNADGSLTRTTTSSRNTTAVMREALRWVTARDKDRPGHFAINLPPGTGDEAYREIAASVGGEPLSDATMELPRYSVGRVWVRAGEAKVDVTRPVMALGPMADGGYVTQTLTVELEGGFTPWRVVRHRPWALGAIGEPAPNPIGSSTSTVTAAGDGNETAGDQAAGQAGDQASDQAASAPWGETGDGFDGQAPPESEGVRVDAEADVTEIRP